MPVNNMSVGRDYSLVWYDANSGQTIDFGDVQNFTITANKHDIKSMPYNADPRFGYIGDGYKITFSITRVNSVLEDYQLNQEDRFRQGLHVLPGYLNETIRDVGGVRRYQYVGFVFWLGDIGDVSREKNVNMKAEAWASYKKRIA